MVRWPAENFFDNVEHGLNIFIAIVCSASTVGLLLLLRLSDSRLRPAKPTGCVLWDGILCCRRLHSWRRFRLNLTWARMRGHERKMSQTSALIIMVTKYSSLSSFSGTRQIKTPLPQSLVWRIVQ